jgi:hypothetical protein
MLRGETEQEVTESNTRVVTTNSAALLHISNPLHRDLTGRDEIRIHSAETNVLVSVE